MDTEDLKSTLAVPFSKEQLPSKDTGYLELALNYLLESIFFLLRVHLTTLCSSIL